MKLISLACLLILVNLSLAKDYTNYKVYDVSPNKEQLSDLMDWQHKEGIDFWALGGVGGPSRIMVSPEVDDSFVMFLTQYKISNDLIIKNVEPSLQKAKLERIQSREKNSAFAADNEPNFDVYWSFAEMEYFAIRLTQQYPNLIHRDLIGKSIEGRDLFGLRISSGAVFGQKPIIFIDAGVHAREWVGPHSVFYLINQLVTNATVTAELVSKVDWVIVPNANPDGYAYSFTTDRMWRKNRRYVNASCTGIDLNRNFGHVWQYLPNSCSSQTHPGPSPISEPETVALTSYMESFKSNLKMYLSTHSYGNYVLWPFGYAFNAYVNNWEEHVAVGQRWVNTINAATGTFYRLGNSADLLYTANGASDDHAVYYANATLAFTLELTGGGSSGFDFPPERAAALARETFLGYREFGLYIGEQYYHG